MTPPSQPHPRSRGGTARPPALRPVPNRGRRRHLSNALELLTAVWRFFSDRDAPAALKLLFLLCAVYVLAPADLVPDVLPVVGWLDDLGVAALALGFLLRTIRPYRAAAPQPAPAYEAVVETTGTEVR